MYGVCDNNVPPARVGWRSFFLALKYEVSDNNVPPVRVEWHSFFLAMKYEVCASGTGGMA